MATLFPILRYFVKPNNEPIAAVNNNFLIIFIYFYTAYCTGVYLSQL